MSVSEISTRDQFDCNGCRYRFSVTSGTIFDNTNLPLWKWFVTIYLICESKKSISANPDQANDRRHLQDRVAPVPPYPVGHAG